MMFGLANGPPVYQRLIARVFENTGPDIVASFYDDIIIGAKDWNEFRRKLDEVLTAIGKAGLTLRLSKCEFAFDKVTYLGFTLTGDGIGPGEKKVDAIARFPTPENVHDLRRFLGMAGFFRRFVRNYAQITEPLHDLLRSSDFNWTKKCEKAFIAIKNKLSWEPVLAIFNPDREIELHTDASQAGLGAVLLQKGDDNRWRMVHCISRRTSDTERNYHSTKLELLAIVWAVERLRIYLYGRTFTIVTDCAAITYLQSSKASKPQLARWAETLVDYDFKIVHRKGEEMAHVDALSRAPVEEAVENVDLLDKDVPEMTLPSVYVLMTPEERMTMIQHQDDTLLEKIELLKSNNVPKSDLSKIQGYVIKDNVLYREMHNQELNSTRLLFVVPKTMRKYIAITCHEQAGHYSAEKSVLIATRRYWFPGIRKYFKQHIRQCVECLITKLHGGKPEGTVHSIKPGSRPFEIVHLDHLGPLPKSGRYEHILVCVCNYTKFVHLYPCPSTETRYVLSFMEEFCLKYGAPTHCITDRGTAFTSKKFEEFCEQKAIRHTKCSTQHPQANGAVERVNRVLVPMLAIASNEGRWHKELERIQRDINCCPHKTTGKSPFVMLYGYLPKTLTRLDSHIDENQNEGIKTLDQLRDEARLQIEASQKNSEEYFKQRHISPQLYNEGDVVVVRRLPETTGAPTKLQPKFRGPYVITKRLDNDTYIIARLNGARSTTTTANGSQLRLYKLGFDSDEDEGEGSDDSCSDCVITPRESQSAKNDGAGSVAVKKKQVVTQTKRRASKRIRKPPAKFCDYT